jgi:hypothetical protein
VVKREESHLVSAPITEKYSVNILYSNKHIAFFQEYWEGDVVWIWSLLGQLVMGLRFLRLQ